jgi:hypothetical protein
MVLVGSAHPTKYLMCGATKYLRHEILNIILPFPNSSNLLLLG